ncbi:three-Cys-motif partner protein TcmP [Mycobacteroides abscessus]|uniref:three-Cys-motif partner protein TcmP n=1 Tax=Mycobacteroides abscessus TaxID=36809 RepID=UPI00148F63E4|nr:three-Cys-motif partner protein TcmP [Mycobacteroides abscessus]
MAREWSYWTRNKLQILADYLPRFNSASQKKADQRIYLDLMAGQPDNVERHTEIEFDGSPTVALKADPGFTVLRFGELGSRADKLSAALGDRFPNDDRYRVVKGNCNETIDGVLRELEPLNWAPTFAFLDQQAAEIHWSTIEKLARFRKNRNGWKTELWILMSPTMIAREARKSEEFRRRVSSLYGSEDWLRVLHALDARKITAEQYRQEMVNLMRFRLETALGYQYTHRIPMTMSTNKMTIFDMVFATDHDAGDKIMRHLYNQAAQREPEMMRQAHVAKAAKEAKEAGQHGLFEVGDLEVRADDKIGEILWSPQPTWNPVSRPWWNDGD